MFSEHGYHPNFVLPKPQISEEIRKILNWEIENRSTGMKPNYVVSWGGNYVFNINEVNTMKHIANELIRTKDDVAMEEYLVEDSLPFHQVPDNMEKLTMADGDLNQAMNFLHYGQLSIKNGVMNKYYKLEDRQPLDHKDLYNFSHPDRQLMESDISLVSSILNENVHGDKFCVLTPDMINNSKELGEYCKKIEINENSGIIHVIMNVSLAKSRINLDGANGHWVYSAIISENKVIYGDPLGSATVPTDLLEKLNPIYRSKFHKDIVNVETVNISKKPNFPLQKCATICGIACCLVAVAATNRQVYFEIIQGSKSNTGLEMIKRPTHFKEQIRLKFLKIVFSAIPSIELFLPKLDGLEFEFTGDELVQNIIKKSVNKSKRPPKLRKSDIFSDKKINKSKNTMEIKKKSLVTKTRSSVRVSPKSVNDPEKSSKPEETSEGTSKPGNESSNKKTLSGEQDIVLEDYNGKMTGMVQIVISNNFPNDDKFRWVITGRKVKKSEFQLYRCNVDNCTGRKKSRIHLVPKLHKKNLKNEKNVCRDVYYIEEHSCLGEQVKERTENDNEIDAKNEPTEMTLGKG